MASWPALKEVRSFLRLQPDADQDAVIQTALAAATAAGVKRMGFVITVVDNGDGTMTRTYTPRYPPDTADLPDSAHQACVMHAGRLYRRRDTVDGTLGFGDMGVVRVGRFDADIEFLYALDAPLVFG
jgi:hypothetical protein